MKIQRADIGEILHQINYNEIAFRLENLLVVGYRWAVIGYEGQPLPGQMRLYRAEIDDGIEGTLTYIDDLPHALRMAGLTKEDLSIPDAQDQLKSLHIMQKDWLDRGEADDIEIAVEELCEAICKRYPNNDFTKWYKQRYT
jgi:hypothetical protein